MRLQTRLRTLASLVVALGLFALAGASCRRELHSQVVITESSCFTCHESEYLATAAPPHPGLFPTTCNMCHTETEWVPAQPIQHDWFLLQNRHATEACTSCHTVGFAPGVTPNQCVGCHQDDFDATTAPPHVGSLPTDCARCHTDAGWRPSTFVHSWPLDGAHAMAACASCHGEPPTYVGTPTTCIDCHRDNRATADAAVAGHSAFATTCQDCHTNIAWRPALGGGHPDAAFPLSGPHAGITCLQCHNPALGPSTAGMNTDCIGCHTGRHANEDSRHRDVRGYPFGSSSRNFCLTCHANGRR